MKANIFSLGCLSALATLSASFPTQYQYEQGDSSCTNGPWTRSCWKPGFNIAVNSDLRFPDTGKTVVVNLEVSRATLSPDGVPREMMVFNGQYPGPPIIADWGDTIRIVVTNKLSNNGTSIHWHGIRQLHSNQMDGTNGITECPIAPGNTKVYTFKATQYGTSWYHSHYSVQYGDGLVGPIIINGPTSANYDIDLGALPLTDWHSTPMFELLASRPAIPPTSQSILVNGTGGPNLSKIRFQPGKKHLIRIINTGINNYFHVGIDQHQMTVVAADFVPIVPYTVDTLVLAVGQRYDVIVEANQGLASYYFRIGTGGGVCDGPNQQAASENTKGALIVYDGASNSIPTALPRWLPSGCTEESRITPFISTVIPTPHEAPIPFQILLNTTVGVSWTVNGQAMHIDWSTPTLSKISNGIYSLPPENAVTIHESGWVYYVITNETPLPHPIHLHGHDFWLLSVGTGNPKDAQLNLNNPMRRDTYTVQGNNGVPGAGGYMIIAFQADNPGAWLMHCHIPFHISGGLGVQFLERPEEIMGTLGDLSGFKDGCETWKTVGEISILQPDSGL